MSATLSPTGGLRLSTSVTSSLQEFLKDVCLNSSRHMLEPILSQLQLQLLAALLHPETRTLICPEQSLKLQSQPAHKLHSQELLANSLE